MDIITRIRDKHNLIFKLAMVVLFAAIIAYLLPKHQVHANRVNGFSAVWGFDDLILEQDFFIRKTKTDLEKEKNQLTTTSPFVFEESKWEANRLDSLINELKSQKTSYTLPLLKALDTIKQVGIIEQLEKQPLHTILIFKNGVYEKQSYSQSFTIQTALSYLEETLKQFPPLSKNQLLNYLGVRYIYSPNRTKLIAEERLSNLSIYKYYYPNGTTLIKQGEVLNNEKRFLINNYIYQVQKNGGNSFFQFLSKWAFVSLFLGMLVLYLYFFRKLFFGNNLQFIFLFLTISIVAFICHLVSSYNLYLYAIPYVLIPLIIRVFYDSRTALFTYLVAILIAAFYQTDKLQFILIQLMVGIITLFSVAEIRRRNSID